MGKISFLICVNKRNVDVTPRATVLILKSSPSTVPFKILPDIGNSKNYTTKHTHTPVKRQMVLIPALKDRGRVSGS